MFLKFRESVLAIRPDKCDVINEAFPGMWEGFALGATEEFCFQVSHEEIGVGGGCRGAHCRALYLKVIAVVKLEIVEG